MMPEPLDPIGVAVLLGQSFARHGVSYAIGGALAYGLWGAPRSTLDVDVNVFVAPEELERVFAALEALEIEVDRTAATSAADQRGLFFVWLGMIRIDVFTQSIAFCDEAERTRVERTIEGRDIWFLSAEAIAVFKLLFLRAKDLADLEQLVTIRGHELDVAYIRQQIVAMMGEDDERVTKLDDIVARVDSPPS